MLVCDQLPLDQRFKKAPGSPRRFQTRHVRIKLQAAVRVAAVEVRAEHCKGGFEGEWHTAVADLAVVNLETVNRGCHHIGVYAVRHEFLQRLENQGLDRGGVLDIDILQASRKDGLFGIVVQARRVRQRRADV